MLSFSGLVSLPEIHFPVQATLLLSSLRPSRFYWVDQTNNDTCFYYQFPTMLPEWNHFFIFTIHPVTKRFHKHPFNSIRPMNYRTRTPNGSLRSLMSVAGILILNSCSTIPEGATAVQQFEKERYLGKWYEIARMDFRFERNLNNTTANYSLNDNGSIRVENRGYDYTAHKWKSAIGKAKFVGDPTVAKMKVSFFGPFYSVQCISH
jgi:hypothetical protein